MRKRHFAIGLAAVALVAGVGVSAASAVPTNVKYAYQSGHRLYVDFNYWLPHSASYNPDFYASIWTYDPYNSRRVRALGRHNFNSEYGFNTGGFYFNYIDALRPGTYYACIRGVVQLDNGLVSKHTDCKKFQLYPYSPYLGDD
jgi:hypothetical protein